MHGHKRSAVSNIKVAFFLNLGFSIIEVAGGVLTNSLAIMSDALHDLGDSLSLGLSWILEKYSNKGNDQRYSYGYRRYSLLAAFINSIILIGGSAFIFYHAVIRLVSPQPVHAQGMLFFALAGILINGIAVLKLKGGKSLNERIVFFHLLEDVLGWVVVLIASVVIMLRSIFILDPLLSIIISLYILFNVVKNLKRTSLVFLQAVPEGINIKDIDSKLLKMEKVVDVHHTHSWSIDSQKHVLTTHIVVEDDTTNQQKYAIKNKLREMLSPLGIEHITIEIECKSEECGLRDD